MSPAILTRPLLSHPQPFFFRTQCIHHRLHPRCTSYVRQSSFLSSSILPPSIIRRRAKTVRKSKPLPISPSPTPRFRRKRILIWYPLAFFVSGAVTYTVLQPDNFVNHVFHGVVRCSRVTVALVRCVYDYRMAMQRKFDDEDDQARDMSECHLRCARRALGVFEKNGGIYIKLGQHLAALSYLIPIVTSKSFFLILGMGLYDVSITRRLSTDFDGSIGNIIPPRRWPSSFRRLFLIHSRPHRRSFTGSSSSCYPTSLK